MPLAINGSVPPAPRPPVVQGANAAAMGAANATANAPRPAGQLPGMAGGTAPAPIEAPTVYGGRPAPAPRPPMQAPAAAPQAPNTYGLARSSEATNAPPGGNVAFIGGRMTTEEADRQGLNYGVVAGADKQWLPGSQWAVNAAGALVPPRANRGDMTGLSTEQRAMAERINRGEKSADVYGARGMKYDPDTRTWALGHHDIVAGSRAQYDDGMGTMRDYQDANIHGAAARSRIGTFQDGSGDTVEYDRNSDFDNVSGGDAQDRQDHEHRLAQLAADGGGMPDPNDPVQAAQIAARRRATYQSGDDRGSAQVLASAMRRRGQ